MMSSAVGLWKLFRDQAERYSGIALKLFGFIAESVFTFIPESRSVHPGTPFGIIQESRSPSPGFLNSWGKGTSSICWPNPRTPICRR